MNKELWEQIKTCGNAWYKWALKSGQIDYWNFNYCITKIKMFAWRKSDRDRALHHLKACGLKSVKSAVIDGI